MLALAVVASAAEKKPSTPTSTRPPVIVEPTASEGSTASAIRGRPATGRLQSIGLSAKQLKQTSEALRGNIRQSGWSDAQRVKEAGPINGACGDLAREINALQADNGAATYKTGSSLAADLQLQVAQVAAAGQSLGEARNANSATQALTQLSASLDKIIVTIQTLPPCCTEGICCHVGFN
jgi:hypothetical protein